MCNDYEISKIRDLVDEGLQNKVGNGGSILFGKIRDVVQSLLKTCSRDYRL